MGDEEDRRAGRAPEPQQLVAHEEPRLLIERAERLVEEDEARFEHQRARDADALAHAAGKLRRIGPGEAVEPHERKRLAHPAPDLAGFGAAAAQAEGDVVPHGEPGEARILLEDDSDSGGDVAFDRPALE